LPEVVNGMAATTVEVDNVPIKTIAGTENVLDITHLLLGRGTVGGDSIRTHGSVNEFTGQTASFKRTPLWAATQQACRNERTVSPGAHTALGNVLFSEYSLREFARQIEGFKRRQNLKWPWTPFRRASTRLDPKCFDWITPMGPVTISKLFLFVATLVLSDFVSEALAQDGSLLSVDKRLFAFGSKGVGSWKFIWHLHVTSRADNITIKKVVANRGNCGTDYDPLNLKFGSETVFSFINCNPMEIDIHTDQGSQTFRWGDLTRVLRVETIARGSWMLLITGQSESITFSNIVVNRGNCGVYGPSNVTKTLKFGDIYLFYNNCNKILEVQLTTDQGLQIFTW
jgi:hypothetical protein